MQVVGTGSGSARRSRARWETIKKWAVLEHDLSVEGGQLTPSLKVKRGVVAEQNKETLDGFYS